MLHQEEDRPVHTSFVLGQAERIADSFGVEVEIAEPGGITFSDDDRYASATLTYREETVYLYFKVGWPCNVDGPHYSIYPGVSVDSDSEFFYLKQYSGNSYQEALDVYRDYLNDTLEDSFPREFFPEQGVWKKKRADIPKIFGDKMPLWQVVKEYDLIQGRETLKVEECFDGAEVTFRVRYSDRTFSEAVNLKDGEITSVSSQRERGRPPIDLTKLTPEQEIDLMQQWFQRKKHVERQTYHNIQRFSERLRELFLDDELAGIFNGSGVWTE